MEVKLVIPFLRIDDDREVLGLVNLTNCPNSRDLIAYIVEHSSVCLSSVNFASNLLANDFDSAIIWRVCLQKYLPLETQPCWIFCFFEQ